MKVIHLIIALSLSTLVFTSCKKNEPEPLIADAGPFQSVQLPLNEATLTGTAVSGGTSNMTYLWTVVSGPNSPTIANSSSSLTKVNNLVAGTYTFQFQVTNSYGVTAVDTASVVVLPIVVQTLVLQPGSEGIDSRVFGTQGCSTGAQYENVASQSAPNLDELAIISWTFNSAGCATGHYRNLIKFAGLDAIPANAMILSAKLSLYGVSSSIGSSTGNSYYPGSPYASSGTNEALIKRVTANWGESTVNWNNQPASTSQNQVEIPASNSQWNYNALDLDITNLVKDIKANANYGFILQMKTEAHYRSVIFASSDNADPAKRPKLVLTYY